MDHPLQPVSSQLPQTFWRSAAVVASLVATVELVLLVVTGSALLVRHDGRTATPKKTAAAKTPTTHAKPAPLRTRPAAVAAARLPRSRVGVMVLNGNGRPGAAAAGAARVRHHGYKIRSVGNASRMSYTRSLVMYRPGYEGEGQRLARDLGIRLVGPLDGMRPAQLHGAQAVLIIGA